MPALGLSLGLPFGGIAAGAPSPPPTDRLLLANGTDYLLLADGSSFLLITA
jgi:hypothetical protein